MDITELAPGFSVTGQVNASDMAEIAAGGFRAIICNRPDGEEPGQPDFARIESAAQAAGLETRYIPVAGSGVTGADDAAFRVALAELPEPVLGYCRTGRRSATLWSRHAEERSVGAA